MNVLLVDMLGLISRCISFKHAIHHAWTAAIIASFIFLAERQHLLGWLDVISIRVAHSIHLDNDHLPDTQKLNNAPIVLHIGDKMYERFFFQKSPLDRTKLSLIIQDIINEQPDSVAIDIDLSPGADEFFSPSQSQRDLDSMLKKAANSCLLGAKCITLVTPHRVQSKDIQGYQYNWMKDRCLEGVEFAYPTLTANHALIISYPSSLPNLGNVVLSNAGSSPYLRRGLCEYINSHTAEQFFNHQKLATSPAGFGTRQLNASYFQLINEKTSRVGFKLNALSDIPLDTLRGKVVFLGGSYGKDDSFYTVAGKYAGVFIHAAGYYSGVYSISPISHVGAFIVDIIIGVILGFVFSILWEVYRYFRSNYENSVGVKNYIIMRSMMFFILAILLFFLILFCAYSARLLDLQFWLNPGPLVIGMFIHSLLTKDSEQEHSEHKGLRQNVLHLIKHHPDLVWQLPLILFVVLGFFHH